MLQQTSSPGIYLFMLGKPAIFCDTCPHKNLTNDPNEINCHMN